MSNLSESYRALESAHDSLSIQIEMVNSEINSTSNKIEELCARRNLLVNQFNDELSPALESIESAFSTLKGALEAK